ncbi:MAG: DNA replication/repair protein RecF [Eubacteriaceae bacterium]|nr:DNA replication/repair protein RecF [Eubacteriaceae bacterium]
MHVISMSLDAFRNISAARLEFSPHLNILLGDNGQGKTNTIEALCLALSGKSPRESTGENFIMKGRDRSVIVCDVKSDDLTDPRVSLTITREGKKHTLNDSRIRSRQSLLDMFSVVFFGPDDLRLVKDSPQVRRDFLNEAICCLYPGYTAVLSEYSRTLRQRGTLLKDYSPSALPLLEVYDDTLVKTGSTLIKYRIRTLKQLGNLAAARYEAISGGRERISVSYISDILKSAASSDEIEGLYATALREARRNDIYMKTTTVGAHRDDISFFLDASPARKFASQGQQRSIALSMKTALTDLIREVKHQDPLILLDDVMSELDRGRRDAIAGMLGGSQVFITGSGVDFIPSGDDARTFRVQAGNITQETV